MIHTVNGPRPRERKGWRKAMTEPVLEVNHQADQAVQDMEQKPVMAEELPAEELAVPAPGKPKEKKKRNKKWIKWGVAAVVVVALGFGLYRFLAPGKDETTVVTDVVQYGSITSKVENSGLSRPKKSESITLTTAGTVTEVFVTEGQQVHAGDKLFTIDSEAARQAVEKARKDVEGYQKQLDAKYKAVAGLNLAPTFSGKLLETVKLNPGDTISEGQVVAKLVDDSTFRLKQYYSYAYKNTIRAGQTASVSIPALMSTVTGRVDAVHMVERISPEGSKLFEVEFVVNNAGSLTADMVASAVVSAGGETIYPYESGKLEYNRSGELKSTVGGTVISSSLLDYLPVKAGQVLVRIDGEDSENEIFTLEQSLSEAQKALDTAQKNLDNCNAVAPIDGTVMGLALTPGQELEANTTVIQIADTSTILVDATVDERNISYVKQGMPVTVKSWDDMEYMGTVESVSLTSKVENGVASYPMVISLDNPDGTIISGSNMTYTLIASESDNCLVVPIQCVKNAQMDDGSIGKVVFVQADSRPENAIDLSVPVEGVPEGFYAVPVETGISDNYNIEIKSGLEADMTVFTTVQTNSGNPYGY